MKMKNITLIQQYTIISLIAIIFIALSFGWIVSLSMEHDMKNRSRTLTAEYIAQEVEKEILDRDLTTPKKGQDYEDFSDLIGHLNFGPNIIEVRIWNKDHVVIWSDNEEMVGQQFSDNHELREALKGNVVSEMSTLKKAEEAVLSPNFDRLMELYIPIKLNKTDVTEAVIEVYQNLEPMFRNIDQHKKVVWTWTAVSFTVLYVVLFGFVNKAAKKIDKQTKDIMRSHDDIKSAKELWEESFDSINDAITIHDKDFNVIRANKGAEKLLDLPILNITRQKCYESYHGGDCPPEGCPSCNTLKTGQPASAEVFEPHLNKYIEIKAFPRFDKNNKLIGLIHVARDITERKKAEEEQQKLRTHLQQSQKMEAIGRLAGGIAHDFNNLLSAIIGYSDLSLGQIEKHHPLKEYLKIINDSGYRAASLTQQLLAFSRKQILEIKVLDLRSIVESTAKLLQRLIGEDIKLEIKNTSTKNVLADKSQIEQILMNLAVNGRDAMPVGGTLVIETAHFDMDDAYVQNHNGAKPGAYVVLSVSDTGLGMTPEVKENIFEPFFTTKKMGKGTGLGLATVYGIVKQHGGYIDVVSEIERGTTFNIYFPVATDELESQEAVVDDPIKNGTETILVAEDDPISLRFIFDTLQPLGYQILKASDGNEALAICESYKEKIDLLLTDVIMPGMNGRQLADLVRGKRPEIKTLFMSGYTDDSISSQEILISEINLLQKPLTPGKLCKKLREVLED